MSPPCPLSAGSRSRRGGVHDCTTQEKEKVGTQQGLSRRTKPDAHLLGSSRLSCVGCRVGRSGCGVGVECNKGTRQVRRPEAGRERSGRESLKLADQRPTCAVSPLTAAVTSATIQNSESPLVQVLHPAAMHCCSSTKLPASMQTRRGVLVAAIAKSPARETCSTVAGRAGPVAVAATALPSACMALRLRPPLVCVCRA